MTPIARLDGVWSVKAGTDENKYCYEDNMIYRHDRQQITMIQVSSSWQTTNNDTGILGNGGS